MNGKRKDALKIHNASSIGMARLERNIKHFRLYATCILLLALLLRIYLGMQFRGYVSDQALFINWMESVQQHDIWESYLYANNQNYPPLFILILGLYGDLLNLLGIAASSGGLSMKILPIIFDMTSMIAMLFAARKLTPRARLMMLAVLALNPAILVDGAMWGQIDILHSTLMVLSVMVLLSNPLAAGLLLSMALLTKLQAIVIAPVIGIVLLRQLVRQQYRGTLLFAAGLVVPLIAVFLCFAANGTLSPMLNNAYGSALNMYPQISLNAMNIWYHLLGDPVTNDATVFFGGLTYKWAGLLLLALAVLLVCAYLWLVPKIRPGTLLIAGAAVNLAFFMLPTEIHERYSIPALMFLIMICFYERKWSLVAIVFSITTFCNIALVMSISSGYTPGNIREFGIVIALVNLFVLCWSFFAMVREVMIERDWGSRL